MGYKRLRTDNVIEVSNPTTNPAGAVKRSKPLVLVVEDNPTNARLTSQMLAAGGYEVAVASDGSQGAELARQLVPDLVLTDLQMPGLDGLAMTALLKQDPVTAAIPVAALTAHAMPEHRELARKAGCAAFLTKPIRLQELLREVSHVLHCRGADR